MSPGPKLDLCTAKSASIYFHDDFRTKNHFLYVKEYTPDCRRGAALVQSPSASIIRTAQERSTIERGRSPDNPCTRYRPPIEPRRSKSKCLCVCVCVCVRERENQIRTRRNEAPVDCVAVGIGHSTAVVDGRRRHWIFPCRNATIAAAVATATIIGPFESRTTTARRGDDCSTSAQGEEEKKKGCWW
jgi:hypothetical protein